MSPCPEGSVQQQQDDEGKWRRFAVKHPFSNFNTTCVRSGPDDLITLGQFINADDTSEGKELDLEEVARIFTKFRYSMRERIESDLGEILLQEVKSRFNQALSKAATLSPDSKKLFEDTVTDLINHLQARTDVENDIIVCQVGLFGDLPVNNLLILMRMAFVIEFGGLLHVKINDPACGKVYIPPMEPLKGALTWLTPGFLQILHDEFEMKDEYYVNLDADKVDGIIQRMSADTAGFQARVRVACQ